MEEELHVEFDQWKSKYLIEVGGFLDAIYYVHGDFGMGAPPKQTVATIKNVFTADRRSAFIDQIVSLITEYVFTEEDAKSLIQVFEKRNSARTASNLLHVTAQKTFRKLKEESKNGSPIDIQGQFSELLLFAVLQGLFEAFPAVRKMPIGTSNRVERHGSDAIHLGCNKGILELYIGEAKTYLPSDGTLRPMISDAVDSVIKHYENLGSEQVVRLFPMYTPAPLHDFLQDIFAGKRKVEIRLICVCSCNIEFDPQSPDQDERDKEIEAAIRSEIARLKSPHWNEKQQPFLPLIHLFFFSAKKFDELLENFRNRIASDE